MIESLRAHGYSLATAIADIIDNSISAGSETVSLGFAFAGGQSRVTIADDGRGMGEEELVRAMRLGSQNPLTARDPEDLGRFGLGLKTASFSQARRLTVVSRRDGGGFSVRRWDLDHLARPETSGWQLLRAEHPEATEEVQRFCETAGPAGTLVLLEVLDRLLPADHEEQDQLTEDHFVKEVQAVRSHLGMVFHRHLSGPPGGRLRILLNGTAIEPWDPFYEAHPATQILPEELQRFRSGTVRAKGFVLPHRDRFSEGDQANSARLHRLAGGPMGWNAQQGIYLYRNRRLIIPGGWLGLGPGSSGWTQEEHFKLARIRVDIPNDMDHEWKIDVKKSAAVPPPGLRRWLQSVAVDVRTRAKEVYAHRGGKRLQIGRSPQVRAHPWKSQADGHGGVRYKIDRRHPVLASLMAGLSTDVSQRLEVMLKLLEESVPVERIWIDTAENPDGTNPPFFGVTPSALRKTIECCLQALIDSGKPKGEAYDLLIEFPAFQSDAAMAILAQMKENTSK